MSSISILFAACYRRPRRWRSPASMTCSRSGRRRRRDARSASSVDGKTVLEKGFGMADLERRVPNRGETIFEAGSVSKQFTAAAVLLLARDGKLSLDDPIRKYVPEMPDYGAPRHDSADAHATPAGCATGAASQGSADGRGRRAPIRTRTSSTSCRRQHALNFPPGTRWSYSNSGYNLAAILVSRVSGMSFADVHARSASSSRSGCPARRGATTTRASCRAARSPTAARTMAITWTCRSRTCTATAGC